jgi:broad specificity phosphatase PhoE
MKKNIFLVRHGESMEDLNNQIYSEITDFQIPLTLEGIEQVKNLAYDLSTKCTAKNGDISPFM